MEIIEESGGFIDRRPRVCYLIKNHVYFLLSSEKLNFAVRRPSPRNTVASFAAATC